LGVCPAPSPPSAPSLTHPFSPSTHTHTHTQDVRPPLLRVGNETEKKTPTPPIGSMRALCYLFPFLCYEGAYACVVLSFSVSSLRGGRLSSAATSVSSKQEPVGFNHSKQELVSRSGCVRSSSASLTLYPPTPWPLVLFVRPSFLLVTWGRNDPASQPRPDPRLPPSLIVRPPHSCRYSTRPPTPSSVCATGHGRGPRPT
jgi:hypothetical protein